MALAPGLHGRSLRSRPICICVRWRCRGTTSSEPVICFEQSRTSHDSLELVSLMNHVTH